MATAYTPGLTVSADTRVIKTRRLPLKGEVLVTQGEAVLPETIVARTHLPGPLTTVRVGEQLGMSGSELEALLQVQEGDPVEAGQVLAELKTFFGLFTSRAQTPVSGTVEYFSSATGNVGVRHEPTLVEVNAHVAGRVREVIPEEGVTVETRAALVQGIFGVGGERHGELAMAAESRGEVVSASRLTAEAAGKILVAGGLLTTDFLEAAADYGAVGVLGGGILDTDLKRLLGYDLGVAITGDEDLPLSVVITEGFGDLAMAQRTFDLLASLAGRAASLSGATQVRAGVIRPEVIVPHDGGQALDSAETAVGQAASELALGTPLRLIREPYFGLLATVAGLPTEPQQLETGAVVRVLEAALSTGETVVVPRANVEIVEG